MNELNEEFLQNIEEQLSNTDESSLTNKSEYYYERHNELLIKDKAYLISSNKERDELIMQQNKEIKSLTETIEVLRKKGGSIVGSATSALGDNK
jgi:hypothetical protein